MSEKHLTVGGRVKPGETPPVPGTVAIKAECGHDIWLSPRSMQLILNPEIETTTICLTCIGGPEAMLKLGREGKVREVPGQREEIDAVAGKAAVGDRVMDMLNAKPLGT